MTKSYFDQIFDFLDTYEVEIVWIFAFLLILRVLKHYLFGPGNKSYIETDLGEKFLIRTKSDSWKSKDSVWAVIIGVFTLVRIYFEVDEYEKLMYLTGSSLIVLLSSIRFYPSLEIEIEQTRIILGGKKFKSDEIASIELWDDLITVIKTNSKKKKIDIDFTKKSFEVVLQMIVSLKKFCKLNSIELIDQFEYDRDKNEMLLSFKERQKIREQKTAIA